MKESLYEKLKQQQKPCVVFTKKNRDHADNKMICTFFHKEPGLYSKSKYHQYTSLHSNLISCSKY